MYKCKKVTCIAIRGVVTKGGWVGIDSDRLGDSNQRLDALADRLSDWLVSLAKIEVRCGVYTRFTLYTAA